MMQSGGFPNYEPLVHFDKDVTLAGGLADKPCIVGAIREEDFVPRSIQEAVEQSNRRFFAILQGILDGMKESGAV